MDTHFTDRVTKEYLVMHEGNEVRKLDLITGKIITRGKVIIVIPAYNEERFIGSVVLKAKQFAETVIVVDDGSTDGTSAVAMIAGADVIRHPVNRGKGVALNTGFRRARSLQPDVVVTIDADGQHIVEEIQRVIEPILDGQSDIVVGSRYLQSGSKVPRHRILGHRVFNFMINEVSGVMVTDSQSGFRAFSPRALSLISFNSSGFSVESEMQLLAREHHLRMDEVAITIQYLDKPKRSVIKHGAMVLTGILRLVGQYRPLLFFGVPGTILMITGVAWVLWAINLYRTNLVLPIIPTVLSALFTAVGATAMFTGIILHSIRGLLLDFIKSRE